MQYRSILYGLLFVAPFWLPMGALAFGGWEKELRSEYVNQEEAHVFTIDAPFVVKNSVKVRWVADNTPFLGKVDVAYGRRFDDRTTVQLDSFVVSTDKLVERIRTREVAIDSVTTIAVQDTVYRYRRNHRKGDLVIRYRVWVYLPPKETVEN